MFVICRSPMGGVGTSVVAAALALRHAHAGHPMVRVDLAGDQLDLLGVAPPASLGIGVATAVLAVIEVGLLVHAWVMVTHAAREGGRCDGSAAATAP